MPRVGRKGGQGGGEGGGAGGLGGGEGGAQGAALTLQSKPGKLCQALQGGCSGPRKRCMWP